MTHMALGDLAVGSRFYWGEDVCACSGVVAQLTPLYVLVTMDHPCDTHEWTITRSHYLSGELIVLTSAFMDAMNRIEA